MKASGFKDCLIDIDRASEFSGDDVDRYSALIDLGMMCNKLVINAPTMTSATISVYVQEGSAVDTVPDAVHRSAFADDATAAWATTAGTGEFQITCDIGLARYVRLYSGANQAADRTFRICGIRD
jgi:hypothetical protein